MANAPVSIWRGPQPLSRVMSFDLNNFQFHDLLKLQDYSGMSKRSYQRSGSSSLISLFAWLSQAPLATSDDLADRIASATGWKAPIILVALCAKYPNAEDNHLLERLMDFNGLRALEKIALFYDRLTQMSGTRSQISMLSLFDTANPDKTISLERTFKAANDVQSRPQKESSQKALMENQGTALVHYLLQQKKFHDADIYDADGLFEHFLIDVQMGPQLHTTRMKQAISTVQLFV